MTMGFGFGSFGLGPYGEPTPPTATEATTTLVNCRLIDGVARDYVTDADGNPEAEDGTANRVYLLLSYADERPEIITPQALREREASIRNALAPLLAGPQPAIKDLAVSFVDEGGGHVVGSVTYFNLATNQAESVPLS